VLALIEMRFGSWELEGLVAVGGVAEIWRVTRDGAPAAVKAMHTHLLRNEDARTQFAIEQRLTTELPRHENVVRGLEAGEVDGRPYVAVELAPGEDVRRLLGPTVVLPRSRAIAIVRAACEAAAHLHAHGYVHGDINPGNLVVDDDDRVTLIDLGVARRIGEGGNVRGTHAYMAPEQIRGEAWTPATDIFALGVVLWELVAGERLFHRGPPWLSMAAVMETAPPPLADPHLDAIAQEALAKDAAKRTATARALADRLR
jgi:serine/threonine protein kinase